MTLSSRRRRDARRPRNRRKDIGLVEREEITGTTKPYEEKLRGVSHNRRTDTANSIQIIPFLRKREAYVVQKCSIASRRSISHSLNLEFQKRYRAYPLEPTDKKMEYIGLKSIIYKLDDGQHHSHKCKLKISPRTSQVANLQNICLLNGCSALSTCDWCNWRIYATGSFIKFSTTRKLVSAVAAEALPFRRCWQPNSFTSSSIDCYMATYVGQKWIFKTRRHRWRVQQIHSECDFCRLCSNFAHQETIAPCKFLPKFPTIFYIIVDWYFCTCVVSSSPVMDIRPDQP